jgi:hypothetical protein
LFNDLGLGGDAGDAFVGGLLLDSQSNALGADIDFSSLDNLMFGEEARGGTFPGAGVGAGAGAGTFNDKNLDPRLRRHLLQVREDGVNSFLLSLSCLSRCALTDECDP